VLRCVIVWFLGGGEITGTATARMGVLQA